MASADGLEEGRPPVTPTSMAQRVRNFGSFVTSHQRNTPVPHPTTANLATLTNASEQTMSSDVRVADITTMTMQPQQRRVYNTNINNPNIMYNPTIVPIPPSLQRQAPPPIPPRQAPPPDVQVKQQHHPIIQHHQMIPSSAQTYATVDPYWRRPTQRIMQLLDEYDPCVHGQLQRIERPGNDALVMMSSVPRAIIPPNIISRLSEDIDVDPVIVTSPSVARAATSNMITPPSVNCVANNHNNSSHPSSGNEQMVISGGEAINCHMEEIRNIGTNNYRVSALTGPASAPEEPLIL